ncbi:Holliday junction branch migration DNA helicase RuvB [Candidatus Gottesmanbacteria bacterium]|nr:Holliday junction branch migration DNA helicase RuvB [Candidatus Gottesmanbacteria bacterium]
MVLIPQNHNSIVPETTTEDEQLFTSLRAGTWKDFYGQLKTKEALSIAISAAERRKEPLEHILLYGPPGLGKTTLAYLVARSMRVNIKIISGPALERAGDVAALLTNLSQRDVLFIDEIHRLNRAVEETLYPAMEDYVLDVIIGKGPSARTVRLDLPRFTLIGATTRIGLLTAPLRDRFAMILRLYYYSIPELVVIIRRAAQILGITIDKEALTELAQRSRGTPRIALKLLKRIRDIAEVKGSGIVTIALLSEAFEILQVDSVGLDEMDRSLLLAIIEKHNGGPVGIETLAAVISEDIGTVEGVLEPYLLQIGFLKRTRRGRMVTSHAYKHLGKTPPRHVDQIGMSL